jgi:hypothetical protein
MLSLIFIVELTFYLYSQKTYILAGAPSAFNPIEKKRLKILIRSRKMSKIYVLDTNVLLQDPNSIFSFEDNEVVIPAVVLEEVDSKKRYMDEIGRNARRVSKLIDDLRLKGRLYENVPLPNGGSLRSS